MVRFRNQSIDPSLDLPYKTFLVPRLTGNRILRECICTKCLVYNILEGEYLAVHILT